MLDRIILICFFVMLTIGAITRIGMLQSWQQKIPESVSRDVVVQELDRDAYGFRFDPDAQVLLGPGADLQPGIAAVDDDANLIVDDRSELGAIGSDDVCLGPADEGYRSLARDPMHLVISKGAFVPVQDGETAQRYRVPDLGWVVVD